MHISTKPKLKVLIDQATHFFRWEKPFLERHFELVDRANENTILYAFGPDVLVQGSTLPALKRVIMLFPGFGLNPYHDLEYRHKALEIINRNYDLAFVNPGPLEVAYKTSTKVAICPFTIDPGLIDCCTYRKKINSLLHVSNPSPQKDWTRSLEVMQRTRLRHEVYPPRNQNGNTRTIKARIKNKLNTFFTDHGVPFQLKISLLESCGYISHNKIIRKYQDYDGFVHTASEIIDKKYVDGKYTACVLEAGLTGSIIFWHDTLQLGNDFETFFNLPVDPQKAAEEILLIRKNIDVEKHSKRTREEVLDKCDIERSISFRAEKIKALL